MCVITFPFLVTVGLILCSVLQPHFGLVLPLVQFHDTASRLSAANIKFIIPPTLRFKGQPGEQYTMFLKDPSGNNLEFKNVTNPNWLFAKYNVK